MPWCRFPRGNPAILVVVLSVSLGLAGCGREANPLPPPGEMNILLICIDTLSADRLGCYTPGLDHSPRLDALAAESVRFEHAYSTSSWTQPAVASLLTGLMPSEHTVQRFLDSLPPEQKTLAEFCRERGLATGAVVSNPLIGAQYGFEQGFDHFDETLDGHGPAVTSDGVTDAALAWLERNADSPFLLFAHYFDPHNDYVHHPDHDRTSWYRGRLRPAMPIADLRRMRRRMQPQDVKFLVDLHHEEIAFTDGQIGRLLDGLDALGLRQNTLVVLTADHGEEFMERGWIGHTATLYDELVAVPLLMRLPGVLAPGTVAADVSLADILPTLVPEARRRAADGAGRSLGPLLAGEAGVPRDIFAEVTFWPPDTTLAVPTAENVVFKSALIAGDLKLIHDMRYERWELYDRAADPAEKHDLFGDGHAAEADLVGRLARWEEPRRAAWLRADDDFPTPDPATVQRLRSLGYVQ